MYAVALAVSKVSRASGRLFQRRNRSNDDENSPFVQVTDAATNHTDECDESEPKNMPLTYSCCMRWAWPAVTFRSKTHPHEVHVSVRDAKGDTALHWACFGSPPVEAVEALLTACPELASAANHEGQLPLHVACSYRASCDVIRALLKAYPAGAGMANGAGSYPMHILCDYGCVVDSLHAILETEGGIQSLIRKDRLFGRCPLLILNGRKGFYSNKDFDALRRERAKYAMDDDAQRDCIRIRELVMACRAVEFWQKASLLILAEYKGAPLVSTENVDHGHIVHTCAGIRECPPSLLEYALLMYPEQLLVRDDNGKLPLHIAASRSDAVNIIDILQACPQASKVRDDEGMLPIELAVQSGWSWTDGVGQLLMSNPVSLEALNVDERLYPRIWSRLSRKPHGSTSALFESLRARPSIVN